MAGIIKRGSHVVLQSGQPQQALEVLKETCREQSIEPVMPMRDKVTVISESITGTDILYGDLSLHIPLVGAHQIDNAITAVELLRMTGVDDDTIAKGIAKAFIPARMELLCSEPVVILDGAHNPNGAQALAAAVEKLLAGREVIAVMGVLRDKDYRCELGMLAPLFSRIYCTDGFSDRCQTAEQLASAAAEYTATVVCESPEAAIDQALARAKDSNCALVICGSLYLAGRVRNYTIEKLNS